MHPNNGGPVNPRNRTPEPADKVPAGYPSPNQTPNVNAAAGEANDVGAVPDAPPNVPGAGQPNGPPAAHLQVYLFANVVPAQAAVQAAPMHAPVHAPRSMAQTRTTMQTRYFDPNTELQAPPIPLAQVGPPTAGLQGFCISVNNLPYGLPGEIETLRVFGPKAGQLQNLLLGIRPADSAKPKPPIFIPTKGRATMSIDGRDQRPAITDLHSDRRVTGPTDVVVVLVVEPQELGLYRREFPNFTYAVLPHSNRGVAYVRFLLHRAMTQGFSNLPDIRYLPVSEYWVLDDNIQLMKIRKERERDGLTMRGGEWFNVSDAIRILDGLRTARDTATRAALDEHGRLTAVIGFTKTSQRNQGQGGSAVGFNHIPDPTKPGGFRLEERHVYKAMLIRPAATRGRDFIPGLVCAEDIDFQFRLGVYGGLVAKVASPIRIHDPTAGQRPQEQQPYPVHWKKMLQQWRWDGSSGSGIWNQDEEQAVRDMHIWYLNLRATHLLAVENLEARTVIYELDAFIQSTVLADGLEPYVEHPSYQAMWNRLRNRLCEAVRRAVSRNRLLPAARNYLVHEITTAVANGTDGQALWQHLFRDEQYAYDHFSLGTTRGRDWPPFYKDLRRACLGDAALPVGTPSTHFVLNHVADLLSAIVSLNVQNAGNPYNDPPSDYDDDSDGDKHPNNEDGDGSGVKKKSKTRRRKPKSKTGAANNEQGAGPVDPKKAPAGAKSPDGICIAINVNGKRCTSKASNVETGTCNISAHKSQAIIRDAYEVKAVRCMAMISDPNTGDKRPCKRNAQLGKRTCWQHSKDEEEEEEDKEPKIWKGKEVADRRT